MEGVFVVNADADAVGQVNEIASSAGAMENALADLRSGIERNLTVLVADNGVVLNHGVEHVDAQHLQRTGVVLKCLEELFQSEVLSRSIGKIGLDLELHFLFVKI